MNRMTMTVLVITTFMSSLEADEMSFDAVADAALQGSVACIADPCRHGGNNALVVGESDGAWWSLVRWDFVGDGRVPEGSVVNSVRIELEQGCLNLTDTTLMRFYPVTSAWVESDVHFWTQPSYDGDAGTPQYVVHPCQGPPSSQWIAFDGGSELRQWAQGVVDGASDYGLVMIPDPLFAGRYQVFSARESGSAPRLVIDFTEPEFVDLDVDDVEVPDGVYELGGTIDVQCEVENLGTVASGSYTATVWAASNQLPGGRIYQLAVFTDLSSVQAGAIVTQSWTVPIHPNINRGDYHICVELSEGADIDSSNNYDCDPVRVTFEHGPELAITDVVTSPGPYYEGEIVSVTATIENEGGIQSAAFDYTLFVSTDPVFDPSDLAAGPISHGPLSGYTEIDLDQSLQLPDPFASGLYWVGVRLDAADGSSDERLFPQQIEIVPVCPADWNRDHMRQSSDFTAYLNDYNAVRTGGTPIHNPDIAPPAGILNTADFLQFLSDYVDGCP